MLFHYLKISIRFLRRKTLFSLINIGGLSIGIASFIVIFLYVLGELSYDKFWSNHENIYRLNVQWNSSSDDGFVRQATSPPSLIPTLLSENPSVVAATRIFKRGDFTLRPDTDSSNVFRETNVYISDENYFKVFQNRLKEGNPDLALSIPRSVVLSESAAIRYFGKDFYEENTIVGRNLLGGKDGGTLWRITGIMEDIPEQSHKNFEILVRTNIFETQYDSREIWSWNFMYSYVLLRDGANLDEFQQDLNSIVTRHVVPSMGYTSEDVAAFGNPLDYNVMSIGDIHLKSNYLKEMGQNGSSQLIKLFLAISILILVIASVNYMNLSSALSIHRTKEVGVRKSLGSFYSSLLGQFLSEGILIGLLSMLVALGLAELFMIYLRSYMNIQFLYTPYSIPYFIPGLVLICLIVGVLSSLYPSMYLSNLKPYSILKGQRSIGLGSRSVRNSLVVFQFVVSVGLILGVLTISDQVNYILTKDLGFNKENVLVIQNDREIDDRREEFKSYLEPNSEIISASFSTGIPALSEFMIRDYTVEGEQLMHGFRWYEIDDSYIETLSLQLAEGRSFSRENASDSGGLILNEAAVELMNLNEPVGKRIIINQGEDDERTVVIIGVVKDFNYESLRREIQPLGMQFLDNFIYKDYLTIKIAAGKEREALTVVQDAWNEFEPDVPMTYSFLDSNFDSLFRSEIRMERIMKAFSGLAIFISCIGLFGLSAVVTEQKKKEIGIRKVLGASVKGVFMQFSSQFIMLSSLGFLIGAPITIWLVFEWLSNYAFHIPLSLSNIVFTGAITIVLTLITVSYQAIKISLISPAETLKDD